MELYEMETLVENLWMKNKEAWEQARYMSYVTAQCQSTKKLDPQEMMPFPWDRIEDKHIDTPEEKEQMWREMKEMEKRMNKK